MDQNEKQDNDRDSARDEQAQRNATGSNDPSHHAPGGGISNLPADEEVENQQRLPPRGEEKEV